MQRCIHEQQRNGTVTRQKTDTGIEYRTFWVAMMRSQLLETILWRNEAEQLSLLNKTESRQANVWSCNSDWCGMTSPKVNEPLIFRDKVNALIYPDMLNHKVGPSHPTRITLKLLILSLQFYVGLAPTNVSPAVGLDDVAFMNYFPVVLT
jgi:hypothetical protein